MQKVVGPDGEMVAVGKAFTVTVEVTVVVHPEAVTT